MVAFTFMAWWTRLEEERRQVCMYCGTRTGNWVVSSVCWIRIVHRLYCAYSHHITSIALLSLFIASTRAAIIVISPVE